MPDVRFGIDASGARQGAAELERLFQRIEQSARATQAAISQVQNASGGGRINGERQRAIEAETRAVQTQAQAVQASIATSDRVLANKRQELSLRAALYKALQSEEAADRAAARATLTSISTLGGANRALAQRVQFEDRLRKGIEAGIVTETAAIQLRKQAEIQFSVAAVKARDLRTNMAGLNATVAGLGQGFRQLVSVLAIHNPALTAALLATNRLAQATRNLSGGFALLGPLVSILGTAAIAFGALAVAGDRTGEIPKHLKGIWEGLKEVAARAGEAVGATQLLVNILEKVEGLLPAPEKARQRADRLRGELAELQASQADPRNFASPAARGATLQAQQAEEARLIREIAEADKQATTERIEARNKLLASVDDEIRRTQELQQKLLELAQGEASGNITRAEYLDQVNQLLQADRERKEQLDGTVKATKEAEERTRAYAEALADLRQEEEQATRAQVERLDDLKVSNELLVKEIAATRQGTEALKAFNVEKAVTLELERQRESGANLSKAESEALVEQVRRQQQLNDELKQTQDEVKEVAKANEQAATDADQVWTRSIENIQRGFGDLFTNLVLKGKDAFEDIGDLVKNMLARIAGELVNANLFGPLFDSLQGAVSGAGGQGAGGPGPLSALLSLTGAVSSGVVAGFNKLFGNQPTATNTLVFSRIPAGVPVSGTVLGSPLSPGGSFGGGGFDVSSVVGALPIIGAIAGGTIAGRSLIKQLEIMTQNQFLGSRTTPQLEKIAFQVASILGGIAGGVVGALAGGGAFGGAGGLGGTIGSAGGITGGAGIGSFLGSFIVGSAAIGQAQVIQQLKSGEGIFEAESRLQAINRGAQIGGPIGAIIGGLLFHKPNQGATILTRPTQEALTAAGGFAGQESPFGVVGLGSFGSDLPSKGQQQLVSLIVSVDRAISEHMNFAEREIVKGAQIGQGHSNLRDSGKVVTQRIFQVLTALGLPSETIVAAQGGTLEQQVTTAAGLITARSDILSLIDELKGIAPAATGAKQALDDIDRLFDDIRFAAPELGIQIENLPELRLEAIRRVVKGFNDIIADGILSLTDPATLAANNLAKIQEDRLKEATALGADLVEVERLTGLERIELLKQINQPVQSVIDLLNFSPSGSSPTAALAAAEARFAELTQPGALGRREDIAASAQTLLSLGEQFLGGPTFATQRDTILATLETVLATFPGLGLTAASDTGAQLTSLNSLTAAGNAANEALLIQVIDRLAAIENENVLLREQLARLVNQ